MTNTKNYEIKREKLLGWTNFEEIRFFAIDSNWERIFWAETSLIKSKCFVDWNWSDWKINYPTVWEWTLKEITVHIDVINTAFEELKQLSK
jgi:hypothetical protein